MPGGVRGRQTGWHWRRERRARRRRAWRRRMRVKRGEQTPAILLASPGPGRQRLVGGAAQERGSRRKRAEGHRSTRAAGAPLRETAGTGTRNTAGEAAPGASSCFEKGLRSAPHESALALAAHARSRAPCEATCGSGSQESRSVGVRARLARESATARRPVRGSKGTGARPHPARLPHVHSIPADAALSERRVAGPGQNSTARAPRCRSARLASGPCARVRRLRGPPLPADDAFRTRHMRSRTKDRPNSLQKIEFGNKQHN
jgi:hypothetical protein